MLQGPLGSMSISGLAEANDMPLLGSALNAGTRRYMQARLTQRCPAADWQNEAMLVSYASCRLAAKLVFCCEAALHQAWYCPDGRRRMAGVRLV